MSMNGDALIFKKQKRLVFLEQDNGLFILSYILNPKKVLTKYPMIKDKVATPILMAAISINLLLKL